MESIGSSPDNDTDGQDKPFARDSQTCSSQNDCLLMPPPTEPPSALPPHLTQGPSAFTSFISPSKEGEVPMEFSPGIKRHCEKGIVNSSGQPSEAATADFRSNIKHRLEKIETAGQSCGSEMHPAELFTKSPGSPSTEFKDMIESNNVQESPSGASDDNFLKRQEKPNLRRCRSLEMRKRLFDMSNTPPNAFKSVFKRPASVETGDQNHTRFAKRPKDLPLCGIKEASTSSLVREDSETKALLEKRPSPRDLDHERIKVAVDVLQSPDVIGDCSREHCLPVITGKHSDLKNISHETMAHLLNHSFDGKFDKLTVIDCRYPYEYKGGHIMGAINLYTEDDIDTFLKKEMLETVGMKTKTHILVFHCEFSSQRGPGLLRHLRKLDRQMNIHQYPQLTFPEMYVLHLGYKEFFVNHPHLCDPSAYIPMADESYINDLKHFRAKAKSWTAGERNGPSKR